MNNIKATSQFDLKTIYAEIEVLRDRVNSVRKSLAEYFVGKQDVIDLMVICTLAQEPLLIVGKPGTAKSDLIVKFTQALGVSGKQYFEYMLTKFTEPSEIIGPVDINALKKGDYIRNIEGKLPEAQLVFLDEVFKSNSAILNTLLTIINERKFYQGGKPVPVPMLMLFGAANEIPEYSELSALKDRFILKIESHSVQDSQFDQLLQYGLRNETYKTFNQKPWQGISNLEDFIKLKFYIDNQISEDSKNNTLDKNMFPREVYVLFKRLIKSLQKEDKLNITDRKVIKLYKIIRIRAFLLHGGVVRKEDLQILSYIPDRLQDFEPVREKIHSLLRLD
ncbi:FIG022979: MoxR-like ATPases [hydrothermal vent metagenome]|uniref:FIG022979: MoxR-like ATPases n=1 Tax=hydrothermal vent metagenome TaxID=652676 RepID=A0A3B0YB24_9ZZZZ